MHLFLLLLKIRGYLIKTVHEMKNYIPESILILIIIVSFAIVMSFGAMSQALSYHDFADKRPFLNIPNFLDVTSNIFFAIFGFIGLKFCLAKKQNETTWSWIIFFLGVTLVCFGSAYYHWDPNNDTLVWDRLPMTIGFMGLFIAILSEFVNSKIDRFFLIPAILLGLFSVIYWHYVDDLRFYFWIQLIPLLTIPVVMILFNRKYTHQRYLIFALSFYIFAKITEIYDKEIFSLTSEQISGHSLKHLLASLGAFYIYLILKKREAKKD